MVPPLFRSLIVLGALLGGAAGRGSAQVNAPATPAVAAPATGSARSDGAPAGLWHTIDDNTGKPRAEIRIELRGNQLVGIVVRSLVPGEEGDKLCDKCPGARHNQPLIGMAILTGLTRDKSNPLLWTGGEVLDPDAGKVYKARVEVAKDGQSLKMRGFIGMAMLGRTQIWRRAGN
jgi:uncharacterized protein (DUF2147 family)